jgi:hypothetical protein
MKMGRDNVSSDIDFHITSRMQARQAAATKEKSIKARKEVQGKEANLLPLYLLSLLLSSYLYS